jgi:hypothetical protein
MAVSKNRHSFYLKRTYNLASDTYPLEDTLKMLLKATSRDPQEHLFKLSSLKVFKLSSHKGVVMP